MNKQTREAHVARLVRAIEQCDFEVERLVGRAEYLAAEEKRAERLRLQQALARFSELRRTIPAPAAPMAPGAAPAPRSVLAFFAPGVWRWS